MGFADIVRAQNAPKTPSAPKTPGVRVLDAGYEFAVYRETGAGTMVPSEYNLVYPGGKFHIRVTSGGEPVPSDTAVELNTGEKYVLRNTDAEGIAGEYTISASVRPSPPSTYLSIRVGGSEAGGIQVGYNYTISFVSDRGEAFTASNQYGSPSIPEGKEFYIKVSSPNGAVKDATVGYRDSKDENEAIAEKKATGSDGVAGPYTFWVSKSQYYTFVAYDALGASESKIQVQNTVSTPITPEEFGKAIEEALPMPPQLTGNVTQDVYAWLAWWYNNYVFYGKTSKLGEGDIFAIKNWTQIVKDLPKFISGFPKYWTDPVGAVVGTKYMVAVFTELFKLLPELFSLLPLLIQTEPKRMLSLYPSLWMRLPNMLKGINQAVIDTAILMLSVAPAIMEVLPEYLTKLPDAVPEAGDIMLNTAKILLLSIPAAMQALPAAFLAFPAFSMLMFMATFIMLPEFVVKVIPIEIPKILTRLFALWPMYTTGIAAAFMAGAPMMMYFEPGIILPALGRTAKSIVATGQNMMGAMRRMPSELLGPTLSGIGSSFFSINFVFGLIWMIVGSCFQLPLVLCSIGIDLLILAIIGVFFVLPAVAFLMLGAASIIPPFSWVVGALSACWMGGSIMVSSLMALIYIGVTLVKLFVIDPCGSIMSAIIEPTIEKLKPVIEDAFKGAMGVAGKTLEAAPEALAGGGTNVLGSLLPSLGAFAAGATGGAAATGAVAAAVPVI
jgi:hypothetical protein